MTKEEARRVRVSYGYTIAEFSKVIGYSYSSVISIENGQRSMSKAYKDAINRFRASHIPEFDLRNSLIGTPELYIKKVYSLEREVVEIRHPEDIVAIFDTIIPDFKSLSEERVYFIGIDVYGKIVGISEVSHGGKAMSLCDPSQVITRALLMGATSMILLHNHPSGNINPSSSDESITKSMKTNADEMRIAFKDHIIIGGDSFYSFENETDLLTDDLPFC